MTWRKWYGIDIVISYCLPSYNPKSSGLEATPGSLPSSKSSVGRGLSICLYDLASRFAFAVYIEARGAFFFSFIRPGGFIL
jgi:hypothetical protein